ncbi:serine protease 123 precursor [Nasonia vitripennis]|uniref:chymotrypsin n=1 Tax=Nasonia vitripennis TaxID=7425 RepID=A0A7M6UGH2_NASVI|nr:serine protease 123 precursor [Nasonia vitripennis]
MKSKYCLTILLCIFVSVQGKIISRIIGGNDAPAGKYTYQAFIKVGDSFQCGASIIGKRYILTAAHCVSGQKTKEMKIVVGTISRLDYKNGVEYGVIGYETHPDFRYPSIVAPINDIALIRLAKDIEYNERIQPVRLATKDDEKNLKSAVLTGWGSLKYMGASPVTLQEINLEFMDQDKCAEKWLSYKKVTIVENNICTHSPKGEGACNGDSGGPLVVDGVQIGVVSFGGMPCGRGVPDVFTRVSSYLDWINRFTY